MVIIAGIDEAGRGAVIGPLIISLALSKKEDERQLKKLAKKDSKQLSPKQREEIFAELKKFVTFRYIEITAERLNTLMQTKSLNDIEAMAMAELIKSAKDADVMIDLPDRYEWTFRKRMKHYKIERFEAQHKADENYPIVAAASICAKVLRDAQVAALHQQIGDFGSGYPSDQKTRAYLKNANLRITAPFIRQRWKTIERVKQKRLFEE